MERKAIYSTENIQLLLEKGEEWNFHDSITSEHIHSLHPYPARFIPQIPQKAILNWSGKGDTIYDPFCGCGTTLVEASLLGRAAVGTDNNSVAIIVSKAKTAHYDDLDCRLLNELLDHFDKKVKSSGYKKNLIPDNKNFLYWFDEQVLLNLSILKGIVLNYSEPVKTLLLSIFSSIIVKVSFQDSDTRYSKINKNISPDDVFRHFKNKLRDVVEILPVIKDVHPGVIVHKADARSVPMVDSESVNLIITSPPYLNAYDYHKYHRQRIHWIDGEFEFARDVEIGSHDEFTRTGATAEKYFMDMGKCFDEWKRVLKTDGKCFIVIGDAIVNKSPVAVADLFVFLLQEKGFELENRWIRSLHSSKRSFNGRSRISQEHILLLRKK